MTVIYLTVKKENHSDFTMTGRPGRASDQFPLRFPEGMRDEIAELAKANGRSMNAEIIFRLKDSILRSQRGDNSFSPEDIGLLANMSDEDRGEFFELLLKTSKLLAKAERNEE